MVSTMLLLHATIDFIRIPGYIVKTEHTKSSLNIQSLFKRTKLFKFDLVKFHNQQN